MGTHSTNMSHAELDQWIELQLNQFISHGDLSWYEDHEPWSILSDQDETFKSLEDFCTNQGEESLMVELSEHSGQFLTRFEWNVGSSDRCLRLMSSGTVVENCSKTFVRSDELTRHLRK